LNDLPEKKYRKADPSAAPMSKATVRGIQKLYGVTEEDYKRMLAAQGGGCVICGRKQRIRRLAIDHHHASGQVRGLFVCTAIEA
jgi:hypothetical protein